MPKKKSAQPLTPSGREIRIRGDRVRSLREKAGLSQLELAYLARIQVPKLSRLENGRVGISDTGLYSLCVALSASADYLLGLRDSP